MTYKETTEFLFNQVPMFEKQGVTGYKEGLGTTLLFDEHLNHPHKSYKTIHVGGTNGKGSCSHTIAAILQLLGYKVGLYTSPHLVDFKERIKVNGKPIEKDYVVDFIEKEREFFTPLHPSFFEITTAMAFNYFREKDVDIAVVEVGLGGRLDCTNIIEPILSVITNISFDHTQLLGDSLSSIAKEKAGIIKENIPVVIGEANEITRNVFSKIAKTRNSKITFAEDQHEVLDCKKANNYFVYKTKSWDEIKGELTGDYQKKNTNTILVAMNEITKVLNLNKDNVLKQIVNTAFSNVSKLTGLMGRWQVIQNDPMVICDTGHNTGGWQYISNQLKNLQCKNLHIIFGMVEDKDFQTIITMLPHDATYYFAKTDSKRSLDSKRIYEIAAGNGLKGNCFDSVKDAYNSVKNNLDKDDILFVGGSTYIVSDFINYCI